MDRRVPEESDEAEDRNERGGRERVSGRKNEIRMRKA